MKDLYVYHATESKGRIRKWGLDLLDPYWGSNVLSSCVVKNIYCDVKELFHNNEGLDNSFCCIRLQL